MSHVNCLMSGVVCQFFLFFFGQSGGVIRWRVCYQQSLPRLVFVFSEFWDVSLSELQFLIFVTTLVFTFCHYLDISYNLIFQVLSHFNILCFVTFWDLSHFSSWFSIFEFWNILSCNNLSYWVLSPFEFFLFVIILFS